MHNIYVKRPSPSQAPHIGTKSKHDTARIHFKKATLGRPQQTETMNDYSSSDDDETTKGVAAIRRCHKTRRADAGREQQDRRPELSHSETIIYLLIMLICIILCPPLIVPFVLFLVFYFWYRVFRFFVRIFATVVRYIITQPLNSLLVLLFFTIMWAIVKIANAI